MPVYPIQFAIPETKFITDEIILNKKKLISPLVPGNSTTYIYNTETEYYNHYKECMFGLTYKKGGWDCLRHYEILCNGCIPYFPDIKDCPINTMTFLPKDWIIQTNELFQTLQNNYSSWEEIPIKEKLICAEWIQKYLKYTREFLTTRSLAKYVLSKIIPSREIQENNYRILFFSGTNQPDYMPNLLLTGFKEIFGENCHDVPKIDYIYKNYSEEDAKKLYGKGFTYTRNIDLSKRNSTYDETLQHDILNHVYDIVIYGSFHRGMPYWEEVKSVYRPNEIAIVCGEDIHNCTYHQYENESKDYHIFIRES